MSELSELAPPAAAPPAPEKPPRRVWPLAAGAVIAGVIVVTGTVAGLGVTGALIAGGCAAAAGLGVLVLWRLPQLRRHFRRPGGGGRAGRRWSFQKRSSGSKGGGLKLPRLGGRRGGSTGLGKGAGRVLKGRSGAGKSPLSGARKALGRAFTGKGRAGGSAAGKARSAKALTGRLRAAGKSLAGKIRAPGGRAQSARKHLPRSGAGVVKGARRMAGLPGRLLRGARRTAGGKGRGTGAKPGRKPGRLRRAAGTAALLPAVPVLAARKLRALIRKRRRGASPIPAAEDKPETSAAQSQPAIPDVPARMPGPPLMPSVTDRTVRKKDTMSSQLEAAAEAITSGVGGFQPESVADLEQFLAGLPRVYEALADGLHHVADRFGDELPVNPAVTEHLREMGSASAGLADHAGEAQRIFRTAHAEDLERIESPRPGEEFMDVSRQ